MPTNDLTKITICCNELTYPLQGKGLAPSEHNMATNDFNIRYAPCHPLPPMHALNSAQGPPIKDFSVELAKVWGNVPQKPKSRETIATMTIGTNIVKGASLSPCPPWA